MPQPHFSTIGSPFIELQSVDSTNNYALQQIHAGLAYHGAVFFAYEQLKGKGQRGKKWEAEKGSSLMFSAVIDPGPLSLSHQFRLSACVAVSAQEFLNKYTVDGVAIKWPNDIYWHDRKAGGILIENVVGSRKSEAGSWKWAVVGIGININQTSFPDDLTNAVSLKQITGKNHDPVELAKELCRILDKNFNSLITGGFDNIYIKYLQHLYKIGQAVKFKKGTRIFEATVKKVSESGRLIVQEALEEEFSLGEIEWVLVKSS